MPKIVDHEKVRKRIVLTSLPLLVKIGYEKLRLMDVALAAGLGRTTLYQYYGKKEDLYIDCLFYVLDTIERDVHEMIEKETLSLAEKISWIEDQWAKNLAHCSLSILFMEFMILAKRQQKVAFTPLIKRMTQVEDSISRLLLEKVRNDEKTKEERLMLLQLEFLVSVLGELGHDTVDLQQGILNVMGRYRQCFNDLSDDV